MRNCSSLTHSRSFSGFHQRVPEIDKTRRWRIGQRGWCGVSDAGARPSNFLNALHNAEFSISPWTREFFRLLLDSAALTVSVSPTWRFKVKLKDAEELTISSSGCRGALGPRPTIDDRLWPRLAVDAPQF